MNTVVQNSLSDVETKLNALLTTLTHSPAAAGAPAAAAALLDADETLTSAIETLQRHQENYARILKLRNEADQLESRVKGIVGDLERFDKEIRTTCDDGESDSDSEFGEKYAPSQRLPRKEIDYRLLLDFARRISKYNQEAAADVANGAAAKGQGTRQQIPDKDVEMSGMNGDQGTEEGNKPVSSVTKNATQWLDDSATVTREVYMMPYPMEDRIRLGLMGQVELAAGEDPDKEVERLIREAEGLGTAEPPAPAPVTDTRQDEAAKAAAQAGSAVASATRPPPAAAAPAPKPKPKGLLDLDLYDPDDDDD
ncbi:Mediator complex subunit Med4 [Penicillium argentinense]|uniref:Mediator of RNA polymerase II transcription subunit 4 n=1 Tax=Penicillium argentinense TaxID=1131581 RepID=A0A9W9JVJ5_9EURO|nr:Mediator complex subunit Med4 [Penicillium argentinense]KAJ5083040.1 Mediator complex subunit Med4 [Penicillium argentinense]